MQTWYWIVFRNPCLKPLAIKSIRCSYNTWPNCETISDLPSLVTGARTKRQDKRKIWTREKRLELKPSLWYGNKKGRTEAFRAFTASGRREKEAGGFWSGGCCSKRGEKAPSDWTGLRKSTSDWVSTATILSIGRTACPRLSSIGWANFASATRWWRVKTNSEAETALKACKRVRTHQNQQLRWRLCEGIGDSIAGQRW